MTSTTTTPTTADRERARCCGTSVGAIIRRPAPDGGGWEYLLIGRAWWPLGWAPVAGHVYDHHADPFDAVKAETWEEAGLTLVSAVLLDTVHLGNLCQAPPAHTPGHRWWVYLVDATGELRPDMVETTGARWVHEDEVRRMAAATVAHAAGGGHARDLAPTALEAVWCELFSRATVRAAVGVLALAPDDRAVVARLYSTPPDSEWVPTA